MSGKKIILCDLNPAVCDAWKQHFGGCADVEVCRANFQTKRADVLVSPANSYGFMTGGIDGAYSAFFGPRLQETVQATIEDACGGDLPVGQCIDVPIVGSKQFQLLYVAPTMRVPMNVSQTPNAYLAFRAVLRRFKGSVCESMLVPGLCTASGGMAPDLAAMQMRVAYDRHWGPSSARAFNSLYEASLFEADLMGLE
jgi:O-acetyl-ADP-ribose deacetylase (regulator of RNase III)